VVFAKKVLFARMSGGGPQDDVAKKKLSAVWNPNYGTEGRQSKIQTKEILFAKMHIHGGIY
jgi:hypothetical protein